jgi:hypothetical protein
MENIHLIFKFLWYSVLFCIWGVSCTSSGTYKKTQMDIYMQYYDFIIDSLSKNPSYVCTRTARQMSVATDSVAYYHYLVLLAKAYMFKSEMDSAKLSMDRAEVFCDGAEPSSLINDLYAEIYNMRQNQPDSSIEKFLPNSFQSDVPQKSYPDKNELTIMIF